MFKPLSLFLGLRYVRSRHGNGFTSFISASSTIGIALGVMVLIVILSAMNGFERALSERLLSVVPHGEMISAYDVLDDWPSVVEKIAQHSDVIAAAPVIKMTGMMQHGLALKGLEIRGVDPKLETQVSSINTYIENGYWRHLSKDNSIVIGAGIAKKLKLSVGDSAQILLLPQNEKNTSTSQNTAKFPVPIKHNVEVVGVFKFGGTVDDTLAYISLAQAQFINQYDQGQVQGIRISVADVFQAPRIIRSVAHNFDHYVYIYDWTGPQGHLFNDIQLVRMVMFIVLVIVIAVASFNIVSTLIMAVNDKKGDIAILKTMGGSAPMIMFTFMIQGLINGILGCTVGACIGIYLSINLTSIITSVENFMHVKFLSADVYFIDFLPTYLQASDVYAAVTTALTMSLIATIYPAWRATKIEPAQVLGQM